MGRGQGRVPTAPGSFKDEKAAGYPAALLFFGLIN